jgi:hypothetical protein
MKLTRSIDTEHDIITASIVCTEISDETKEALHDYTKTLKYGDIDFSAKIKVTDGMPEIVADDDPDGEEVSIKFVDKSFVVDENLNLTLELDSNKMSSKELTTAISNVEILSKAKALIWVDKIEAKIQELVDEAREQNAANIEGTVETVI